MGGEWSASGGGSRQPSWNIPARIIGVVVLLVGLWLLQMPFSTTSTRTHGGLDFYGRYEGPVTTSQQAEHCGPAIAPGDSTVCHDAAGERLARGIFIVIVGAAILVSPAIFRRR
jgi:hypothetical protein